MEFIVATEQPPRVIRSATAGRRANRDAERIQTVGVRHALNAQLSEAVASACGLSSTRLYPVDLAWVAGADSCPLCVVAVEDAG
jgi:hypothetical protein